MRIGYGHDIHRLVSGRRLFLGGVLLEHPLGLLGHSDADVLCHALCDALLGAAGLGDIGLHFPDRDPAWKDSSGLKLLSLVMEKVLACGWQVANADASILAEQPRLQPHIPAMRENLAKALQVDPAQVSIKAGTNEGMDAVGRGEAVACHAVVLLLPAHGSMHRHP